MAFPTLSIDSSTGCGPDREKKALWIGSKALVGFGSHLSGSVGAGARVSSCSRLVTCPGNTPRNINFFCQALL